MNDTSNPPFTFSSEVQSYLASAVLPLRLACRNTSGWPVVLSLWYLFRDGEILCATQASADVVAYLQNEPRCAFEIAGDLPPYCGVRGRAAAAIDPDLGPETLHRLLHRYLGGTDSPLAQKLLKRSDREVALRLQPVSSTTWNFSNRMADIQPKPAEKLCP